MPRAKKKCARCLALPDRLYADYLNKGEKLPEQASALTALIGENSIGTPTIRRCPACGQLYGYYHDKDAIGGEQGWGCDEELLWKISRAEALQMLGRMLIEYQKRQQCASTDVGSGTRSKVWQRGMVAAYGKDIEKIERMIAEFEALKD